MSVDPNADTNRLTADGLGNTLAHETGHAYTSDVIRQLGNNRRLADGTPDTEFPRAFSAATLGTISSSFAGRLADAAYSSLPISEFLDHP